MSGRVCHWVFTTVKRAAVKPRFPHRIARHAIRHKIAATWVCVAIGTGAWNLPALLPTPYRELTPVYPGLAQASGGAAAVEFFPPESFGETPPAIDTAALIAFFGPPDCCTPAPQPAPEQPPEQPVPVPTPEPGSIELLATAAAALAIIRGMTV